MSSEKTPASFENFKNVIEGFIKEAILGQESKEIYELKTEKEKADALKIQEYFEKDPNNGKYNLGKEKLIALLEVFPTLPADLLSGALQVPLAYAKTAANNIIKEGKLWKASERTTFVTFGDTEMYESNLKATIVPFEEDGVTRFNIHMDVAMPQLGQTDPAVGAAVLGIPVDACTHCFASIDVYQLSEDSSWNNIEENGEETVRKRAETLNDFLGEATEDAVEAKAKMQAEAKEKSAKNRKVLLALESVLTQISACNEDNSTSADQALKHALMETITKSREIELYCKSIIAA